ncbi:MAG: GyrI-like domain-containing protein [Pseudomonadota bacterium]
MSLEPNGEIQLAVPRQATRPTRRVVGIARRDDESTRAQIPEHWSRFNELGLDDASPAAAYGIWYNSDGEGNMDYFCGIEVSDFGDTGSLDRLVVPANRSGVFHHRGHVSDIRNAWQAIWNQGLLEN